MAYRVDAPYVTVKVLPDGGTPTTVGFYAGAILPSNVDPESAKALLRKKMVEKVSDAELPTESEPVPAEPVTAPATAPVAAELPAAAVPAKPAKNAPKNG